MVDEQWIAEFLESGVVSPSNPFIILKDEFPFYETYEPAMQKCVIYKGKIASICLAGLYVKNFLYNEGMFEEAGFDHPLQLGRNSLI